MSTHQSRRDPWRVPALLLWSIFFLLGLWPELTFSLMRHAGYVFSQNAIINSYNFISWCLTGFVVHFAYHRSLEARLSPLEALGKAFQLGILAFVAFADILAFIGIPLEQIQEVRSGVGITAILTVAAIKLVAWLYLFSIVLRYYWQQRPEVIGHAMPWMALVPPEKPNSVSHRASDQVGDNDKTKHSAPPLEEQAD